MSIFLNTRMKMQAVRSHCWYGKRYAWTGSRTKPRLPCSLKSWLVSPISSKSFQYCSCSLAYSSARSLALCSASRRRFSHRSASAFCILIDFGAAMTSPIINADIKWENVLQRIHGFGSDVRLSAEASKILEIF